MLLGGVVLVLLGKSSEEGFLSIGPRKVVKREWNGTYSVIKDIPEEPRRSSKKDTKRWCRGKVGEEHRYEWKEDVGGGSWMILSCVECGRKKDYCFRWLSEPCKCGMHTR